MINKIFLLFATLLISLTSCGSKKEAILTVDKTSIELKMMASGAYCFTGIVDNSGEKDAYGAMVSITYETMTYTTEEASAPVYDIRSKSSAAFKIIISYSTPTRWINASCIEIFA